MKKLALTLIITAACAGVTTTQCGIFELPARAIADAGKAVGGVVEETTEAVTRPFRSPDEVIVEESPMTPAQHQAMGHQMPMTTENMPMAAENMPVTTQTMMVEEEDVAPMMSDSMNNDMMDNDMMDME